MEKFYLEKPDFEKEDGLAVVKALGNVNESSEVSFFVRGANEPDYRYWDSLKHKKPLPSGLTSVQAWYAVKLLRSLERQDSPIRTEGGRSFGWTKLRSFERYCHEFDLHTGGELMTSVGELKTDEKKRLISKGLMDEAIASAQLEGADTGRAYAKKMLREKIKPRNSSDQMIINNHRVMMAVEDTYKNQPLSLDLLFEMHSSLVEKTLDDDGETPSMRTDGLPMYVLDKTEGIIYHEAPGEMFVRNELNRLVEFANNDGGEFFHPIIKASTLHFWIGYLHPFTDGNGRLARIIFYWYLLRQGYWAFSYLPIAAKIKSSGKKGYVMAYVYSEQDNYDLTYFINYLLKKSIETYKDFQSYVNSTRESSSEITTKSRIRYGLNDRQIQLIKYLSADEGNFTTVASHISVYGVSRVTAIKDLKNLIENSFLKKKKIGRADHFYGTKLINSLIKQNNRFE